MGHNNGATNTVTDYPKRCIDGECDNLGYPPSLLCEQHRREYESTIRNTTKQEQ